MAQCVHLWPGSPRDAGDAREIKAELEWPEAGRRSIWFRLPSQHLDAVTASADPFLLAALFPAMRHGHRMHVHGQVSWTLLRNLEDFQAAWTRWCPDRYTTIDLTADEEADAQTADGTGTLLAFSGGLDSCFSAWRHTRDDSRRARRNLVGGLMVHGFDIPLPQTDAFERAAENSRRILASVEVELIPVACNVRDLNAGLGVAWRDVHGTLLASCLHLLSGAYGTGLIASTHPFDDLRFPWGSNPLTDPMLSSAGFSIVNDGGAYSRSEKARAIATWDEAMRGVRVCWEGRRKDRNCGKCPTCVWTALCFAVEGVPQPESIPVRSLVPAVEGLAHERLSAGALKTLQKFVAYTRAHEVDYPWADALDRVIRRQRRWALVEARVPWLSGLRDVWQLIRSGRRRDRLERRLRGLTWPRRGAKA